MDASPDAPNPYLELDRSVHAAMGRLTQGLSPASCMLAGMDWLLHLGIAPGRQLALVEQAREQFQRWIDACAPAAPGQPQPRGIEPLPQDHRFDHPAWRQWPFHAMEQGFLLTQQWWQQATTGVRGVTAHHEEVATFGARQWLDLWSPSNFFLTNPETLLAAQHDGGLGLARGGLNLLDDMAHAASGEPAAAASQFVPGRQVAATPGEVVLRNRLIELIRYTPTTTTVHPEPVLIVPSWIMKYYILDLSPHNSMVRYLVGQGHTVFILSWRNPDASDRDLGMDDYLALGPFAAMQAVRDLLPGRQVHGVGYCLGGTLLSIAAAAWARDGETVLKSLSLLATETDFDQPGELSLFIDASQIAYLEDLMWQQGCLDGRQMGSSFTYLNTRDLLWSRMVRDYLLGTRQPLNDLMAWNADVTRMPYRMHSEYLKSLYLENSLAHGGYRVGGRPVALSDIEVPIFLVGTVNDHVSPWRSVFKLHLLNDGEITFVLASGGHNAGIVSEPGHPGRSYRIGQRPRNGNYRDPDRWLAEVEQQDGSWWPAWHDWLAVRSGRRAALRRSGGRTKAPASLGAAPGAYVGLR